MRAAVLAALLALAACVGADDAPPAVDAGVPTCADVGCSIALCTSDGACSCVPPSGPPAIQCEAVP